MELGSMPTRMAGAETLLGLRIITWLPALEVIKKLLKMGSKATPCGTMIGLLVKVVVLVLRLTILAVLLLLLATTAVWLFGSMATPVGPCCTPMVVGACELVETRNTSTRLAPRAVTTALPVPTFTATPVGMGSVVKAVATSS